MLSLVRYIADELCRTSEYFRESMYCSERPKYLPEGLLLSVALKQETHPQETVFFSFAFVESGWALARFQISTTYLLEHLSARGCSGCNLPSCR